MAKKMTDVLREEWVMKLTDILLNDKDGGWDVLQVKSNELSIPVVDKNGDEHYINIKISVPKGSRDGDEYDGYAEAEEYQFKQREKMKKEAEKALKKAKNLPKAEKEKIRKEVEAERKQENEGV